MNQYSIGILLSLLSFGYLTFTNEKTGLFKNVRFFRNNLMESIAPIPYIISNIIILFSPTGLVKNLITIAVLHFLVNQWGWNLVHGLIDGIVSNIKLRKFKKENGL